MGLAAALCFDALVAKRATCGWHVTGGCTFGRASLGGMCCCIGMNQLWKWIEHLGMELDNTAGELKCHFGPVFDNAWRLHSALCVQFGVRWLVGIIAAVGCQRGLIPLIKCFVGDRQASAERNWRVAKPGSLGAQAAVCSPGPLHFLARFNLVVSGHVAGCQCHASVQRPLLLFCTACLMITRDTEHVRH